METLKHGLKFSKGTAAVQWRLDVFLLVYRNTPYATTKELPVLLFTKHQLHMRLDCLKPSVVVHRGQDHWQNRWQQCSKDYRKGQKKWTPGHVLNQTGPVSYEVKVGAQGVWKRHVDQMLTHT